MRERHIRKMERVNCAGARRGKRAPKRAAGDVRVLRSWRTAQGRGYSNGPDHPSKTSCIRLGSLRVYWRARRSRRHLGGGVIGGRKGRPFFRMTRGTSVGAGHAGLARGGLFVTSNTSGGRQGEFRTGRELAKVVQGWGQLGCDHLGITRSERSFWPVGRDVARKSSLY